MTPARPIVITLLLAASAGGARGADQTTAALQACIDSARQADAACSKLTEDPAERLECFVRARNQQLACLQRALPDAPAKTTSTKDDHNVQPREVAPKPATADAPSEPAPQQSTQANAPDRPRGDGPVQGNTQASPQPAPQEAARKSAPDSSESKVAEPSKSGATANAPADTASITTNTTPAPQPTATPSVESPPPTQHADAVSEPKEPAGDAMKDIAVPPAKAGIPPPAAKPATPATRADTPAPRPDAPVARTDVPAAKPEAPMAKPEAPSANVDAPAAKPDIPVAKTDVPAQKTETPAAKANPALKPDNPVVKTDIPAAKPEAPVAKVDAPAPKPEAPIAKANVPAGKSETPVAKADAPAAKAQVPLAKTDAPAPLQPRPDWVVSEMPSPVDYRPLLTAVIRPTSRSEGGPSSLTVRCLGGQTALSIHTEGTWHAAHKNALPVDHQINDQSVVRQMWTLAVDAKSATYTGDPVALLRSFPEGVRLTINVPDGGSARNEATFLFAGWDAVRKRIGTACKWPKANAQASSGRH